MVVSLSLLRKMRTTAMASRRKPRSAGAVKRNVCGLECKALEAQTQGAARQNGLSPCTSAYQRIVAQCEPSGALYACPLAG